MATAPNQNEPVDQWERVALELRALRESQQKAYGNVDNATLGRYLAGESDAAEAVAVEKALSAHPELKLLADLVRGVLDDLPPISDAPPLPVPEPGPVLLPMRPRKRPTRWYQRWSAVAAAASLLMVCGAAVPSLGLLTGPEGRGAHVAAGRGIAGRGSAVALAMGEADDGRMPPPRLIRPDSRKAGMMGGPGVRFAGEGSETRHAYYLNHEAEKLRDRGEYVKAVDTLRRAHEVCEARVSPDHPARVRVVMNLARVYGDVLADAKQDQITLSHLEPAPPGAMARSAKAPTALAALKERIDRKSIREVQADVVAVLASAVRVARTTEARRRFITALGELGPAAGPAVPVLTERLETTREASETIALLTALRRIGPAARPALPALRKVMEANDSVSIQSVLAGQAVRALTGKGGRVGVLDAAGAFTVATVRDANEQLLALADRVEVAVETIRPGIARKAGLVERRLTELGPKAVLVVIQQKTVSLYVSPALKREGFPEDAIRDAMAEALKDGEPDRALSAGLGLIAKNAK